MVRLFAVCLKSTLLTLSKATFVTPYSYGRFLLSFAVEALTEGSVEGSPPLFGPYDVRYINSAREMCRGDDAVLFMSCCVTTLEV